MASSHRKRKRSKETISPEKNRKTALPTTTSKFSRREIMLTQKAASAAISAKTKTGKGDTEDDVLAKAITKLRDPFLKGVLYLFMYSQNKQTSFATPNSLALTRKIPLESVRKVDLFDCESRKRNEKISDIVVDGRKQVDGKRAIVINLELIVSPGDGDCGLVIDSKLATNASPGDCDCGCTLSIIIARDTNGRDVSDPTSIDYKFG